MNWSRLEAAEPAPWERPVRTLLRTLHLLAMALFVGAAAFGLQGPRLSASVHATLATGLLFAAFELWRAPIWIVQVRGLVSLAKIALLAAALAWPAARLPLAVLLVVIGSVVSHAPARLRYWSVLHRRMVPSSGRG